MFHKTIKSETPALSADPLRTTGEAEFRVEELFFSRTDTRGVIQSFNGVFERISGFAVSELEKAPHRLVRHPDMPKGLFWLMWDGIKAGHPVGAYVRNRTKDGAFYWVFALISPIEGGFLSVRLKPTSGLLPKIEALYADLRRAEVEEGLSPEASANMLLQRLAEMGYGSYAGFQTRALAAEASSRERLMTGRDNTIRVAMARLLDGAAELNRARASLSEHLAQIGTVSINMRIMASHAEPGGGPISTISENYLQMSERISRQLDALSTDAARSSTLMATEEEHALFVTTASDLMETAAEAFVADTGGLNAEADIPLIRALAARYRDMSRVSMEKTARMADRVITETRDLRLALQGLDQVRMLCRIENGRFGSAIAGLASIVEELDRSHALIQTRLDSISVASRRIVNDAEAVLGET